MVDALGNLEYLNLYMNGFFGALHREIQGLKSLKELRLFGNYFAGTLPGPELASLKNLEVIDMYANFFTGTIPSELGKLKKLRVLDLRDNNLTGSVPKEICNLKLDELITDCLGPKPEVRCSCCTICCRGLPDATCVDVKTGIEL
jgi:Ran GTPase-activating protein (RanGAP) involved in mRNA processing and transport